MTDIIGGDIFVEANEVVGNLLYEIVTEEFTDALVLDPLVFGAAL